MSWKGESPFGHDIFIFQRGVIFFYSNKKTLFFSIKNSHSPRARYFRIAIDMSTRNQSMVNTVITTHDALNVTTNSSFMVTVRTGRHSTTFIADVVNIIHKRGVPEYHLLNLNHDYSGTFKAAELSAAMERGDLELL